MALKLLAPLAIAVGGSLISNLLFPSRKENKPPERQNFQDAGIGALNWGVGTFWCTPKLIAKSKVIDSSKGKNRNKKGGGKPRCSAVYVVCKGPIQGLTRILGNGKVLYDIRPGYSRNHLSGLCSNWYVVDGLQATTEPLLSSILGANLAASLEGWALLCLDNIQLKDSGGDLPTFEVEVMRYPLEENLSLVGTPLANASAFIDLDDTAGAGGAVPISFFDTGVGGAAIGQITQSNVGVPIFGSLIQTTPNVPGILRVSFSTQNTAYFARRLWRTGAQIPAGIVPGNFTPTSALVSTTTFTPTSGGALDRTFYLRHVPYQNGLYYFNNLNQGYTVSGVLTNVPYNFGQAGEVAVSVDITKTATTNSASGTLNIAIHRAGFYLSPIGSILAVVAGASGTALPSSSSVGVIPSATVSFSQSAFGGTSRQTASTSNLARPFYYRWIADTNTTLSVPSRAGYVGTQVSTVFNTSAVGSDTIFRGGFYLKQGSFYFKPPYQESTNGTIFNWFGAMRAYTRSGDNFNPASATFNSSQTATIVNVGRWISLPGAPLTNPGIGQSAVPYDITASVEIYDFINGVWIPTGYLDNTQGVPGPIGGLIPPWQNGNSSYIAVTNPSGGIIHYFGASYGSAGTWRIGSFTITRSDGQPEGSAAGALIFNLDVSNNVGGQLHLYKNADPEVKQSAYFSPNLKTISVKVVQCQDGLERIYQYTTSARVYGAFLEYRQGAGINNAAGDIAFEAEGRVSLHTSAGNFPVTGYLAALGSWYSKGQEITPGLWETARALDISPYCVWDEALDGEVYQIKPTGLVGDYYPVPSVDARLPILANSLHNQPLTLGTITTQLLMDFPESVGQWWEQLGDATDPRLPGEAEFYGWTIDGGGTVFDSYSRLLASLGVDLVDNYGSLTYVNDNNRTLTFIDDSWVSRKFNDETGAEEPFYTYEIMPESVAPDEIRLMFRDAGRDGEESLSYYRSPLFSEAQNSETISTNAVMAFVSAQTLAFRLFARTATRGKKYTVRLNYRAFGSIDIGHLITFNVVDSDRPIWDLATQTIEIDQPGWVIERQVTLLVAEVTVDENFNSEVIGYEYLVNSLPNPVVTPDDLTSPPDGFPDAVLMQSRVVDVPIWDGSSNTLQKHYQAIVLSPNTVVIPSSETSISVNSGEYEVLEANTPGDLTRYGEFTGTPIKGVVDDGTLTFSGEVSDNFGSVSEADFLAGQGLWMQVGSEVVRAATVTWTGAEWVATSMLRGLLGTEFSPAGVLPVTILGKLKAKQDSAQDLGVPRDIRTYAGIQDVTTTPAVPFNQSGFTATPYPPTNLGYDQQPNGDRILSWTGHGLGNGSAVNGQKPLNIGVGQSYEIELVGSAGAFRASTQQITLTQAQLGASTGFRVRQRGDYNLVSNWATDTF